MNGQHTYTATGCMRKAELSDIMAWVIDAWVEIDPQIIVQAFKKCCISNSMDGTEDNILWEEYVSSRAAQDDEDVPVNADDDYYGETPAQMTDDDIAKMFESDDDNEDFERFTESDIRQL